MKITHTPKLILSLLACAALSACGGGGGGNAAVQQAADAISTMVNGALGAPGSPSVPANVSTIVSSVPAPSFAGGSEELAAFNLLNQERGRCGFGRLAQSSQLDAAARAHADYQLRNNLDSHFEDRARYPTGFTGSFEADRFAFQGYTGAGATADEYSFYTGNTVKTGKGERTIRALLGAPYHLRGLMAGFRDVGISTRSSADVGVATRTVFVQINAAYKTAAGPQVMTGADVLTYPCEGSTGVNRALYDEQPQPVPGRNLSTQPLGTAVYIAVREGQTLRINSASMTKVATGRAVVLRAPISAANDPNGPCTSGCFLAHQAYVIPDAPLDASSAYTVTVSGTNNGVGFTRTFRFNTGT